ncbi:hypothetical protein ACQ4LE_002192 [Meloidogyne hapla]
MVASPKGAVMSSEQARPSTAPYDDDMWMSDDISFSSYPREPPNHAYNFVPPLSESSYRPSLHPSLPPSLPRSSRSLLRGGVSPVPPIPRQVAKRKDQDNGDTPKRTKTIKEIKKSKIPVKKKQKKRVTANPFLPSTSDIEPEPELHNVPLRDSPPVPPQASKREQEAEDVNIFKRRKENDPRREYQLKQYDRLINKEKAMKKERIRKLKKIWGPTVPLDQAAMLEYRLAEDVAAAPRRRSQSFKKW